jgi:O-antigen/teichoic acid export membrane protein
MTDDRGGGWSDASSQCARRPGLKSLLTSSIVVAAATGVAQILGYVLNVLGPRFLTPDEFGALGALLSLVMICTVLPLGLQAVAAQTIVARGSQGNDNVAAVMIRFSLKSGVLVGGALLMASPLLTVLMNQPNFGNVALVALMIPGLSVGAAQYGVAQGLDAFGRLAVLILLHTAMRSGLGIAFLIATGSTTATIFGMFLGASIAACVGMLLVKSFNQGEKCEVAHLLARTAHASHALLALFAATNIDMILARSFLPAEESGAYAVGAIVSRVAFWLPFFVVLVAFPRMVTGRRVTVTLWGVSVSALLGALLVVGLLLFPKFALVIVAGDGYGFMASSLWLFGLIGSLFSIARVILYSRLAVNDARAVAIVWIDFIGLVVTISVWHSSVANIAAITAIWAGLLVAVGMGVLLREFRHATRDSGDMPVTKSG